MSEEAADMEEALEKSFRAARLLCGDFFSGGWKESDSIVTQLLVGGYINHLVLCSLPGHLCDENSRPFQAVVRFLDDPKNQAIEVLAFNAVAKAGLGPQLLGVFHGGRIEEYIPSRLLTWKDARDPSILRAVAYNLAAFHSLDISIKKHPRVYSDCVKHSIEKRRLAGSRINLDLFNSTQRSKLEEIIKIDHFKELTWAMDALEASGSRTVLTHCDMYCNNILLKNKGQESNCITPEDLSLIDIEGICYYYRGLDIGFFLYEAAFDYAKVDFNPDMVGHLSQELVDIFLASYLERWQQLNPHLFDPQRDNLECLMKEQLIGSLIGSLHFPLFVLNHLRKKADCEELQYLDYIFHKQKLDRRTFKLLKEKFNLDI